MNTTERKAVDVLAVKPAVLAWLRAMVDKSELYQRKNVMNHAISGIGLLFDERDAAVAALIEAAKKAQAMMAIPDRIEPRHRQELCDAIALCEVVADPRLARVQGGQ